MKFKRHIWVGRVGSFLLEIKDLTVRYGGAIALHDLSVTFESGKVAAIIGPNGAGKSSLLNAISGINRFTGSIKLDSIELSSKKPEEIVRMGVIQCPQSGALFPELTVKENLLLGAYSRRSIDLRVEIERVLELFQTLKSRLAQRASTLSGGERQMVALGRSLMGKPRLLLLDEPTLGLAPSIRDIVEDSVRTIIKEVPVVIVEQDVSFVLDLANTVCVLASGSLVFEGNPSELKKNDALREAYLGVI